MPQVNNQNNKITLEIDHQILWDWMQTSFNLQDSQIDTLKSFCALLIDYNKKINLISRQATETDILINHFMDSLMILMIFKKDIFMHKKIMDIGSGGGFPVVPLAIVLNQTDLTAIDATKKKTDFLKTACAELKINNLQVVHSRIETLTKNPVQKFHYATARAVTTLDTLIHYAFPILQENGLLIAYKGPKYLEELVKHKYPNQVNHYPYSLPFINSSRVFLTIKKS